MFILTLNSSFHKSSKIEIQVHWGCQQTSQGVRAEEGFHFEHQRPSQWWRSSSFRCQFDILFFGQFARIQNGFEMQSDTKF